MKANFPAGWRTSSLSWEFELFIAMEVLKLCPTDGDTQVPCSGSASTLSTLLSPALL
jgi:hypothetical protein